MTPAKPAVSLKHQSLVRMMAEHFARLGYQNIKADLPGYIQPDEIQGTLQNHRPDLTCVMDDRVRTPVILEAETSDSVEDAHTTSQWSLFRSAANQWNGQFHIVVDNGTESFPGRQAVQHRLAELGLVADEIWTPAKK